MRRGAFIAALFAGPAHRAGLLIATLFAAGPSGALDLSLPPNARETAERSTRADSYAAPIAPFDGSKVPSVTLEGEVRRQVWRIGSPGLTPLQVLEPLRAQVREAGYEVVLDCDTFGCGGFDFRFAVEVLPAPNMYVNLRAYRFVTALQGPVDAPEAAVTLLVSTTPTAAFVQVISAGAADLAPRVVPDLEVPSAPPSPAEPPPPPAEELGLRDVLFARGHAVLYGLEFDSGATALGPGPFGALRELAVLLEERPGLMVALVGHTDSTGSSEANEALSRARAQAVRDRLVSAFGIDASRLEAEGTAYLAPRASNLTPEGREANRRVEVVLLSER